MRCAVRPSGQQLQLLAPAYRRLVVTMAAVAGPGITSSSTGTLGSHDDMLAAFAKTIPALDGSNYKGQHGKLGVVGGCATYTGAPFFAAQSAHKVGADMTYVLCTPEAAPIIKSYSPDMMVLPLLPALSEFDDHGILNGEASKRLQQAKQWLSRMTVLVVGPGLGEDAGPQAAAAQIIRWAREADTPLVIDGSGISVVTGDPSLVQGYSKCVLTPNMAELGRLASAWKMELPKPIGPQYQEHAPKLAAAMDGPILVSKGPEDVITDGHITLRCNQQGSNKRCGGIGDVLSGTMGTFLGWQFTSQQTSADAQAHKRQLLVSSYAACDLLRAAAKEAFIAEGRSMSAEDVIASLPAAFRAKYGQ